MDKIQYVLTVEIGKPKKVADWWEPNMEVTYSTQVFDNFIDAKKAIRETVCKVFKDNKPKCFDDENYMQSFSYNKGDAVDNLINNVLANPEFEMLDENIRDSQGTTEKEVSVAYASNDVVILREFQENLLFNIHNMQDENKCYFFNYYKTAYRIDRGICSQILIKLTNTSNTTDTKYEIIEESHNKTVKFGNYPQTEKGDDNTPIEWIVIDESDKYKMLLSDKCLFASSFDEKGKGLWKNCSLRKILNEDFYNKAFNEREKNEILPVGLLNDLDKVWLLNNEQFHKCVYDNENLDEYTENAKLTDYAMSLIPNVDVFDRHNSWWITKACGIREIASCVAGDGFEIEKVKTNAKYVGVRPVILLKK